jgi:hypothetical protein
VPCPLLPVHLRGTQVVFTASLAKYADPLLDLLDKNKVGGSPGTGLAEV